MFKDMAENLQKKHLSIIVHIPVSKGYIKVFCNIVLFVFLYLSHEILTLLTLWCDFSKYQIL